jgi:hypothetical protein
MTAPWGSTPTAYEGNAYGENRRRGSPYWAGTNAAASAVTLDTTLKTMVTVQTDTLEIGDRLLITAQFRCLKTTEAMTTILVTKATGTASVWFDNSQTDARCAALVHNGQGYSGCISSVVRVVGRGTCQLELRGTCGAGTASVALGDAQLSVVRL